ncbi:hypothetical protein [Terriglobus albidus]|uniref:hypothetical protein n=1 Tax=Terriglobus albidus TaxID=1592106 RepID=UPI0021E0EF38|nr:hypothetical protein [Terriglobus albidus]
MSETFELQVNMTVERKLREHYVASLFGLALAVIAVAAALLFSFGDSWDQMRVLVTIALSVLAIPLIEFGKGGTWFPRYSAPRSMSRGLFRGLIGISGLGLFLSAAAFCFAFGQGKYERTTVGFIFGICATSFLLIRAAITGTLFPGLDNKK